MTVIGNATMLMVTSAGVGGTLTWFALLGYDHGIMFSFVMCLLASVLWMNEIIKGSKI